MNYFIIAGEASGDLHASHLIDALKERDAEASFSGLGGDKMQQAGCTLVQHYRNMAFMGIAAVVANLDKVKKNFKIAHRELLKSNPNVLILIDYPSFNLKIAEFCRKNLPATKIVYYIPPKVWAWKSWRIHKICALCDEVLGIFPFEEAYYRERGYTCTYVGNPTVEQINCRHQADEHPYIAILPGSRKSEISHCLPTMLQAARSTGMRLVVTAAPGIEDAFYSSYLQPDEVLTRDTHRVVQGAMVALVNSGTATLETALIGTPQIAVYHLALSRIIHVLRPMFQHKVFSIPYFTLVNIIAGHEVIRELVADDFTVEKVQAELQNLLRSTKKQATMKAEYNHIRELLGTKKAAVTAADRIYTLSQMAASM